MTPVQCAAALKTIACCLTALTLTGCISMHSIKSEGEFSAPPVNPKVCNYDWQLGSVLFSAEGAVSYRWNTLDRFGHTAAQPRVEQLAANCLRPAPARPATVSIYYLEHTDKTYHWSLITAGRSRF